MYRRLRRLVLVSGILALVMWLLRRLEQEQHAQPAPVEILVSDEPVVRTPIREGPPEAVTAPPAPHKPAPEATSESAPPPADDLTRISGIGPKISAALQEAGVSTYAQLAEMDADQIRQLLDDAGVRIARPDTWAEQAKDFV
jgi:predicted flap endonuclease-1-like 5' DNA nuclease